MLGKGLNFDSLHSAWSTIWGLEVSPKVRHFLWRMGTHSLPVRSLLKYRHLTEDALCPWCGLEEESMGHAIFSCPRVQELWEVSQCLCLTKWKEFETMCDFIESWKGVDVKVQQRGATLAWVIWGERNYKVFQDKTTPNEVLINRVQRLVDEQGNYASRIYSRPACSVPRSANTWVAPPKGVIKLNVDVSLATEGWIGIGVVARDWMGKVQFAACRRCRAHWPVEIAEAKAVANAVKLGRRYGLEDVIIETDCQSVVSRLSKNAIYFSDLDTILGDISEISSSFKSISWSHVRRDGNAVAHQIARLVPFGTEQIWENHCPTEISPYVLMDALSLD
ncbi:uncharacterized protein [Spinacia oleracea]|uniref:RNase H type-1 domain-containing protein n=1 Tax=Spinacia oleracea TaxID=3562 RepID=A0A9R0JLI0_SPIOL|nr:uncharacterized protein LOC110778910 [Spinacia oleracea]